MMMIIIKLDPPERHYSSSKPGDKWHLPPHVLLRS